MNDKPKCVGFSGALMGLLFIGTFSSAQQAATSSLSGPDSGPGRPIDCSGILANLSSSAGNALLNLSRLPRDRADYMRAKHRVSRARAAYGAAYAQCLQEGPGGKECAVADVDEQNVHRAESEEAATKARLKSDGDMADNKTGRLTQSAAAFNYCLNLGGLSSGTQDNSFQTQQQKAEQAHQRYLALTAYNGALGNAMAGHGRQTSVSLGKGGSLNVWVVNGKPDLSSISILYRTPGECPGAGFCPFTSYTTWSQMSNQQQQQIEELLPYVNLGPKPSAPMPLAQLDSLTGSIIGSGQGTTALPPYPGLGPSSSGSNFQNRDGGLAIVGANAAGGGSGQGSSVDLNGGTPLPDRGGPIGQASSSSSSDSGPNYILPNGLPVITVGAPGSWVPIGNGMEKWMPQNPNDPLNNVYKYGTMISLGSGNDAWVPFHGGTPPQGLISNLGGAIQPSQLAALMEMYATGAVPSS